MRSNEIKLKKDKKDKTPNPQMNKEKQWLVRKTLRYTSSSNQDTTQLFRPQKKALDLRPNGPGAKLKLASTVVVKGGSQDISTSLIDIRSIDKNLRLEDAGRSQETENTLRLI